MFMREGYFIFEIVFILLNWRYTMKQELIRLTTGTRYVYFSSLYNEESPIYQKMGQHADEALSNIASKLHKELTVDPNNNKVTTALEYLKQAAEFERTKEVQFFKNLKATHSDIENMFNIKLDAPSYDDYIKFIIDINRALEGAESFKKQVDTEVKRMQRNKAFDSTKNYQLLTHNLENGRIGEKQVANSLEESLFPMKRGRDNGSKVFEDIFSNRAHESDITRIIIEQFGPNLFRFENNSLKLDARRTNALIKLLSDQVFKLVIAEYQNLASDTTIRTEQISNIILGPDFQRFYKSLMDTPNLDEILIDVAHQYSINTGDNTKKSVSKTAIDNIKDRLRENYNKIKDTLPKEEQDFDAWLVKQGITKKNLEALYRSTTTVSALSYYTGEDLNLTKLAVNHIIASLGGGKNPTDDIYAGKLITTFEAKVDTNAIEQELASIGRKAYQKIKATGGLNDFMYNTEILRQARNQQEQELANFRSRLDKNTVELKDILSHVNIHTTVKGYKNAGRDSFVAEKGFQGAAFGPNLIQQLNIIDEMSHNGIISLLDVEDLQFALVNAGAQMIGRKYKRTLEDYFSMFVGFLMFNDAQLAYEDVSRWMETNIISDVNDIHLYELNGATVPSSFLLQNTYEALAHISDDIQSTATRGTKAVLNTYNSGPVIGNWEQTLIDANKRTKLDMHFLAGFLDILNQINDAMPG